MHMSHGSSASRVDSRVPNEAIVARLFAHGGLTRAELEGDGVMRDHHLRACKRIHLETRWF
jgi:hypothetical protein